MRPRLALIRIAGLAALAAVLQCAPASAQGLFDQLFGGFERPRHYVPPQANAYSEPYASPQSQPSGPYGAQPSGGTGRAVSYCVRLCDGRYFPIQHHANATPIQLCGALCPAAKTQVFNGSQIDYAIAHNGARYADLDSAFVYRKQIVAGCTCNGKDAFGLAKIDVASDPTLRPGDIVASGDNVKVALTAMAASKERAIRDAASDRPALRGGSRRTAAAPAASAVDMPADTDERPED